MRPEPRRCTWLFALALAGAAALPAQAQDLARERGAGGPMLGGALEDLCRGQGQPSQLCASYLRGSFEGLMIGQASMTDGGGTSFCLPDVGVTLTEVREAFLTLMLAEPDRRTQYAGVSLLDTLQDAWPCADDDDLVPYVETASAQARRSRPGAGAALRRASHRSQRAVAHMLR
ncbi:Rap1a/Tai family immunity protein [Sphingomonas sp. KR3-1]|uniref:Rap1a/Tai family immunity protein n=1 Tax=Sphingomonas sp. KR3-1 TaxID=3156611 RepID=UPI0032B3194F